jgi:hypothetical protein
MVALDSLFKNVVYRGPKPTTMFASMQEFLRMNSAGQGGRRLNTRRNNELI